MKFIHLVPFIIASSVGMIFVMWLPLICGQ